MKINFDNFGPCLAKIRERGRLTEGEAKQFLSEVANRAEEMRKTGQKDPVVKAAKQLTDEWVEKKQQARVDALRNLGIRDSFRTFIEGDNIATGGDRVRSYLYPTFGGQKLNIETMSKGLTSTWLALMDNDLRKEGLLKVARDPAMMEKIATEIYNLRSGTTSKASIKDPASRIAEIISKYMEQIRQRLNDEGARIGDAKDFVGHMSHDTYLMRRGGRTGKLGVFQKVPTFDEGFQKWWGFIKPLLDPDRTFKEVVPEEGETMEQAQDRMGRSAFDAMVSGVRKNQASNAPPADGSSYIKPEFEGSSNLARKLSEGRVLFFKDGESWARYMKEYGKQDNYYSLMHDAALSAGRHASMMHFLGTNPTANFNMVLRALAEKYRATEGWETFEKSLKGDFVGLIKPDIHDVMAQLDGTANIKKNEDWAEIGKSTRAFYNAISLGSVMWTHLTAVPMTVSSAARMNGVNTLESLANTLKHMVTPYKGEDLSEVLAEGGAYADGATRRAFNAWSHGNTLPGYVAAMESRHHKMTILPYLFENVKAGFREMIMNKLGRHAEKDFDDLEPHIKQILGQYGINKPEWDLLRSVDRDKFKSADGKIYMTPQTALNIGDEAIDPYIKPKVDQLNQAVEQRRQRYAEMDAKEEEWHQGRMDKLHDKIQSLTDWVNKKGQTRDVNFRKRLDDGLARIDELKENLASIESTTDLIQSLKGIGAKDRIQQILEDVEGGYESEKAEKTVGKTVEQQARTNLSAGETLGRRRAQIERRVKELHDSFLEHGDLADAANKADVEWLQRRIEELHDGLTDAYTRMQERMGKRANELSELDEKLPERIQKLRDDARTDIADRLMMYLQDQADQSVVTAGVRERAMIQGNTQPGSPQHELFKSLWQYKSWPLAAMHQLLIKQVHDSLSTKEAWLSNIFGIAVMSMFGGYIRGSIRDMINGKEPQTPQSIGDGLKIALKSLAQGGGLGVPGDVMFGEIDRSVPKGLAGMGGPAVSDAEELLNIYLKWQHSWGTEEKHDYIADLMKFGLRHVPFSNLFYLKASIDYLLTHHIQNAISPGYWERVNRRLQRESGRTILGYSPGEPPPTLPYGAGGLHGFLWNAH